MLGRLARCARWSGDARRSFFAKVLYKARVRIEQMMGKIKRFKRIALRCEKTARPDMCAVSGCTVTCDLKKGRHVYLICRDPANPTKKFFVPESEVLDQINAIQVPSKLVNALLAH